MSASEKLKALAQWEVMTGPRYAIGGNRYRDNFHAAETYIAALPQIVAVVEAAEKWPKHGDDGWIHVHSALAALEDALS